MMMTGTNHKIKHSNYHSNSDFSAMRSEALQNLLTDYHFSLPYSVMHASALKTSLTGSEKES